MALYYFHPLGLVISHHDHGMDGHEHVIKSVFLTVSHKIKMAHWIALGALLRNSNREGKNLKVFRLLGILLFG